MSRLKDATWLDQLAEETIFNSFHKKAAYETSTDFTEDLDKIQRIIKSPKWEAWMKETDKNYDTRCVEFSKKFDQALNNLVDEIDKAK